jgi:DNA topoisomerase VI subunit B
MLHLSGGFPILLPAIKKTTMGTLKQTARKLETALKRKKAKAAKKAERERLKKHVESLRKQLGR